MKEQMLNELQALYDTTGNPLYAMQAIVQCGSDLDILGRRPLPEWVREYVETSAIKILALAHDEDTSPSEATKKVPASLDLVGPGRNSFRAWRDAQTAARVTFWYERRKQSGTKAEFLAVEAKKELGVKSVSQVRRILKQTRERWNAMAEGRISKAD